MPDHTGSFLIFVVKNCSREENRTELSSDVLSLLTLGGVVFPPKGGLLTTDEPIETILP